MKYFNSASKPADEKYDGTIEKLHHFLGFIRKRSTTYGMMSILSDIAIGNNKTKSLITQYGSITEAQMTAHAAAYQSLDNRKRQAASMLEALIVNSIEPEVYDELEQRENKYTVKLVPTGGTAEVERIDGAMMLYQLIQMVCIDTTATESNILDLLSSAGLIQAMSDADSDIQAFNRTVNALVASLKSRQGDVPNLIAPLFKAYKTCADRTFAQYIARKEEQYEEGNLPGLKHTDLIRLAIERYNVLKSKRQWKQKTQQELDFIALTTEMMDERQRKQLTQQPIHKQKQQQKDRRGPNNTGEWVWKGVEPKEGEPTEKKFRGKQYIYCPHHGSTKWVLKINRQGIVHLTNCRARLKNEDSTTAMSATTDDTESSSGSEEGTPSKRDIRIAQAFASMKEEEWPDLIEDEDIHVPRKK
ncbi:hypothetical protein SEMRO_854_G211300.1 [Seminavis robusta]|uniref:Uncharacterized protein n=1 Tax=Seminavis robusta TaxID=568900 RepID=A0A9N8HKP0_9STRA|nr:hypothetical protein SEMRO_854_G211300.1 [Seminavis robusta]|eukprot:Sro854_g211300.1 n/a (416) ;mRNA; f:41163-42410